MHADHLDPAALAFLAERHLAMLATPRADGTLHQVPVGFAYDHAARVARIITRAGSWKARRLVASPGLEVSVGQVDGGRWLSLGGPATVTDDPLRVAAAVAAYAARYRDPAPRPDRVAIEIEVTRVLGRA